MMPWYWNPDAHNYIWRNGKSRFISRREVMDKIDLMITASTNKTGLLADMVSDGTINVQDWKEQMRKVIKSEYIDSYLAGIGGRDQMKQSDWGRVGRMLKDQYKYLDGFTNVIAEGDYSKEYIANRARMYMDSAYQAYEKAVENVSKQAGYDLEKWVLGQAEHCPDCLAFAAEGWKKTGYFPMPRSGNTVCLTNCRCHKEYKNSQTGEMFGVVD